MMKSTVSFLVCMIGLLYAEHVLAQNKPVSELSSDEIKAYKQKVTELVNYLESTLNFIGDKDAVPREKEIVINESYLKIFKNDKVQIEDDLDENRDVVLYKDVQAYLKDIRFFFRQAQFKFHIVSIEHFINENNQHFFKVTLNRDLDAVTVAGDTVSSRKTRYIEVNLDPEKDDLKIASIYTTRLNEKEEHRLWWNGLNTVWKNIFGTDVFVYDSIELSSVMAIEDSTLLVKHIEPADSLRNELSIEIEFTSELNSELNNNLTFDTVEVDVTMIYKRLSAILKKTQIDISDNEKVTSLEPLSELSGLININASGTTVTSLMPLRNLNKLEVLDISNTPVDDLTPIKYSNSIKELNCSYTLIRDPEPLAGLTNIEQLSLSGLRISNIGFTLVLKKLTSFDGSETLIHDANPLSLLMQLQNIDLKGSLISDLSFASKLDQLKYLNVENTPVSTVEPLSTLHQLEILKISNTAVEALRPLDSISSLKRIYWDSDNSIPENKKLRKERAIQFMKDHPGTLVIFESDELERGWKNLEGRWKDAITEAAGLSENPTKEELHNVLRIESLTLVGGAVSTLKPLLQLYNLKKLNLNGLITEDYSPIASLIELVELDISNTAVDNIDFATNLFNLQTLKAEHTEITSLQPLESLVNLEFVYVDYTGVDDVDAFKLRERSPDCLVVYKSNVLMEWWQALSNNWKEYFTSKFLLSSPPTAEQLHKILYLKSLEVTAKSQVSNITSLAMLSGLEVLKMSGLQISNVTAVVQLQNLRELYITQMPVSDITFVSSLPKLETLDLENTSVEDLDPLENLRSLKILNISGTQVNNIKPLRGLVQLKKLMLNNTSVKNLKHISDLSSLELLQCYNTRISEKNLQRFKESNPNCEVVYY